MNCVCFLEEATFSSLLGSLPHTPPPVGLDPDVLSSQMKEQKVIKPRLWLLVREEYVSVKCISGGRGGEGRGGKREG